MIVKYGKGFEVVKPMRERVMALESELEKLPQVDCPIKHHFAPGIYAREMSIPAGTVVTGAVHKTNHLILVSKGRLHIVTPDGTREVEAGDVIECKAGMKNAMYALEDSKWVNLLSNPDDEHDENVLVETFTEAKADQLLGGANNKQRQNELKKVEA